MVFGLHVEFCYEECDKYYCLILSAIKINRNVQISILLFCINEFYKYSISFVNNKY